MILIRNKPVKAYIPALPSAVPLPKKHHLGERISRFPAFLCIKQPSYVIRRLSVSESILCGLRQVLFEGLRTSAFYRACSKSFYDMLLHTQIKDDNRQNGNHG